MEYIDQKFKDADPVETVKNIQNILHSIGIEITEKWNDSKVDNCFSLRIETQYGAPGTNGKGITKEFARASAYGEFIERLQDGLFFYKYQSLETDPAFHLPYYAPDKRYMDKEELIKNGEWMDPIIAAYGNGLTRESLAAQCAMYAGSDKILTLPYYSIFEDKYVYLPAHFVEHIYSANGCCVGNSPAEAIIHALSEIMERRSNIQMIMSGKAAPIIPKEKYKDFRVVNRIIEQIREDGGYDIELLDYSCGTGFPVVAVRIINKKNKGYIVNVGADPVLEIAMERALTELFQGRTVETLVSWENKAILNNNADVDISSNIINQLETDSGLYTVEFFADVLGNCKSCADFPDNRQKSNPELLRYVLQKYREIELPVYVRNNSFLGFPGYWVVVPGFSESRPIRLFEKIPQHYFADRTSDALRNLKQADELSLMDVRVYREAVRQVISKQSSYIYLSGLPLQLSDKSANYARFLGNIHYAYAFYRMNDLGIFSSYLGYAIGCAPDEKEADYLKCIYQYTNFMQGGVSKERALAVLKKFYKNETWDRFVCALEKDDLFGEYLFECDKASCENCRRRDICRYNEVRGMMQRIGERLSQFTDGQDRENFAVLREALL